MSELSPRQYKLLRKLCKRDVLKSELSIKDIERAAFFCKCGFVELQTIFESDNSLKDIDTKIHITPAGEAAYKSYGMERRRWAIPVIISLIALFISILSIYKANQPIDIHLDNNIIMDNNENTNATSPM